VRATVFGAQGVKKKTQGVSRRGLGGNFDAGGWGKTRKERITGRTTKGVSFSNGMKKIQDHLRERSLQGWVKLGGIAGFFLWGTRTMEGSERRGSPRATRPGRAGTEGAGVSNRAHDQGILSARMQGREHGRTESKSGIRGVLDNAEYLHLPLLLAGKGDETVSCADSHHGRPQECREKKRALLSPTDIGTAHRKSW